MNTEVLIIGRGIIGLTIGLRLIEKGYKVVFVDHNPLHKAASWGNAGLISPTFSTLSPSVGSLKDLFKWFLSEKSSIRIPFRSFFINFRWIYDFLNKSKLVKKEEVIKLIYDSALEGLAWYDELSKKIEIDFKKHGLIEVYFDHKKLHERIDALSKYNIGEYRILSADELLNEEPNINKEVAGGIFYPDSASLNPRKLMLGLISLLKDSGARFLEEKAIGFNLEGSLVKELITDKSKIKADVFVMATGAYKGIYRSLKLKIPLIAGRGYSLIVNSNLRLNHHLMGGDIRISISEFERGKIKASGYLELGEAEEGPTEKCFKSLIKYMSKYLPNLETAEVVEKWVGSRPCTPDLMPIIDRFKENLLICTGHCRLGVTLAPYSSRIIVDMIDKVKPTLNLFKLSRFL